MEDNSRICEHVYCKFRVDADLMHRIKSSWFFIPIIVALYFSNLKIFSYICWCAFLIMLFEIFSKKNSGDTLIKILASLFCFAGIAAFITCRRFYGINACFLLICVSSFSDIGAYTFGKILKGPKLCPKISPNKTWAGFFGGILSSNMAFFLCMKYFNLSYEIFVFKPLMTAQILAISCIIGDLLESAFKRKIKVKDMSNIFPGHGGFLDRLDSVLFVSTVFTIINLLK